VEQALSELAWLLPESGLPAPILTPDRWPLLDAPYSGTAAFWLQQKALDSSWERLRGVWHFLLPGPHETAPQRTDEAHWRYLLARFARALASRARRDEAPALALSEDGSEP
jgi:hypothetical protein